MSVDRKARYWYLQLESDFFKSEIYDYLMTLPDGANYVMLLLNLYDLTKQTEFRLERQLGRIRVPYTDADLQRLLKYFSAEFIHDALELFEDLEIILRDDDEHSTRCLCCPGIKIRNVTGEAIYKAMQRERQQAAAAEQGDSEGDKEGDKEGDNVPYNNNSELRTQNSESIAQNQNSQKESYSTTTGVAAVADPAVAVVSPRDQLITYAIQALVGGLNNENLRELNEHRIRFDDAVIRYAIDEACACGHATWGYTRSILKAYAEAGVDTVEKAAARRRQYDAVKQSVYQQQQQQQRYGSALNYQQRPAAEISYNDVLSDGFDSFDDTTI